MKKALQELQDKALGKTKPVQIITPLEACIVRSYSKHENKNGFYAKLDEKAADELATLRAERDNLAAANAELREALIKAESALTYANWDGVFDDNHTAQDVINARDNARAVLAKVAK